LHKRFINAAAVTFSAVALTMAASAPAEAATPAIQITLAYYNSPGSDRGSNASLNAEYIRLTNKRSYTINVKSWTLRDLAGHVYKFASDFRLAPGASVYVHTGKGTNSSAHRYWGMSWYVWNNTGDKAIVRNAAGTTIDTCSWGSSGSYSYC
jgi:hypothetical protein